MRGRGGPWRVAWWAVSRLFVLAFAAAAIIIMHIAALLGVVWAIKKIANWIEGWRSGWK